MCGCGCEQNNDNGCKCGNDDKSKDAIKEETNSASTPVSGQLQSWLSKIGI